MLTRERFLDRLNLLLDRREFRAAISWCEQAIATLWQQPVPRDDDSLPVAQLPLSQDVIDTLDAHGVATVGQLRTELQSNAAYYLGTGKPYEQACRALISFDERISRIGPHGQGAATTIRPQR